MSDKQTPKTLKDFLISLNMGIDESFDMSEINQAPELSFACMFWNAATEATRAEYDDKIIQTRRRAVGIIKRLHRNYMTALNAKCAMQAEIDKRDSIIIKCAAIFNNIDNHYGDSIFGRVWENISTVENKIQELNQRGEDE